MATAISPKLQALKVENYRALRDIEFKDLTPFTVLLGANGSGKSTVFDVFAFLHEAFADGLRKAWDRRNRMAGIRSVGESGPVAFKLQYSAPLDKQVPSAAVRNPDGISGGTWEALERVVNKHGYHMGGLRNTGCASGISAHMDIDRNSSPSFRNFRDGVARLIDSRKLA